ncbi:MAG: hypothetical protein NZ561_09700 [Phycisphaerae bacterium]|nr:hypothetical protein [Phycisphaerae bacterium]
MTASLLFAGCTPYLQIKSDLVYQARQGVQHVRESLEARQQLIEQLQAAQRQRLDQAFDADVRQRASLEAAWVIQARRAYAAAIDALHRQQQESRRAHQRTIDNLAAIESALHQLALLQEIEQRLSFPEILP